MTATSTESDASVTKSQDVLDRYMLNRTGINRTWKSILLNDPSWPEAFDPVASIREFELNKVCSGGHQSSVVSSAFTILRPQVWVPSTHLHFFNLYYWNCNEKRTKINKKEAGIGPFLKKGSKVSANVVPLCIPQQRVTFSGIGCGSVGRAAASDSRDPRFESGHRQILFSISCNKITKNKEKVAGNGPFKKSRLFSFGALPSYLLWLET